MKKVDYYEYYTMEEYQALVETGSYLDPKYGFKVIENE